MASISPISIDPSSFWDGNDGSWNTFIVQAGTPPQQFRLLPSTAGQETWVVDEQGCLQTETSQCPYLRGALPFDGHNSTGWTTSESSTWDAIGLYTIADEAELPLGINGNGSYGFETVIWGNGSVDNEIAQSHQVMASIAAKSVFLGLFGLGPRPSNFTKFNDPVPSFLTNLVASHKIASKSWAYTAGAAYRNQAPASLTLGGYDTNRFEPASLTFPMYADDSRPLQVRLSKITADDTLSGTVNLLPEATYHFVDSTVPHIWVPDAAISDWVAAFGLTYDNNTDLFLINDTMRERLLSVNPTVTFTLTNSATSNDINVQNVVLPYAAFDLEASWPIYENATRYFPIRRAMNSTQYSLGRTFFQEAYVIADFSRNNFSVAQARFDSLDSKNLVTITNQTVSETGGNSTTPIKKSHSSGISAGAIAGIVIGVLAILAILGGAAWFMRRRNQQEHARRKAAHDETLAKSDGSDDSAAVPVSDEKAKTQINELGSGNVSEMGSPALSELGASPHIWGDRGAQEVSGTPLGHGNGMFEAPGDKDSHYGAAEAPGSEAVTRHELYGSDVTEQR